MRKHFYTRIGTFGIEVGNFRAIGIGFDIGGYDGDDMTLALHLGVVSIYLSYSSSRVMKLTKIISKLRKQKYTISQNSSITLNFTYWALSITLLGDHVGEEAVFKYYLNIPRFIKGRSKVTYETLSEGTAEVVMPEKRYEATYKIQRLTWHYPRWFKTRRVDIDIKVPEGIPHDGKGENSWDCGMDYTYGMSTTYKDSLRQALDELALSVIKQRQRHSSLDKYSNVPSGRPPENKPEPITGNAAI